MSENQKIKAIFFDLDGTLLSYNQRGIPDSAMEALDEANSRGILLFAATGRNLSTIRTNHHIQRVNFTGYVTMNGQYCIAGDKVVHELPLHRGDIVNMFRYLEEHPLTCIFQGAESNSVNKVDELLRKVMRSIDNPVPEIRDPWTIEETLYQICVLTPDSEVPSVIERMPHSTFTRWHTMGMDIIPIEGNKWMGIRKMMEHYGISREETAAFGDGENDIEMLREAGFSVAMGNASDIVKAAADYITDDVNDDGVYKAMRHILGETALL